MPNHVASLLVCGATFRGLAAAAAAAQAGLDVIVIERSALVGHEYIDAFHPGSRYGAPRTALARAFQADARARNLQEEGGPLHLPALHPLLCALIKRSGLDVRFLTELVGITAGEEIYRIEIADAAGLHELRASRILDTTSTRLSTPGEPAWPDAARLNAYVHGGASTDGQASPAALPPLFDERLQVRQGRYPAERIVGLELPPTSSWQEARAALYSLWASRPEAWRPWTIAATAGAFEVRPAQTAQRLHERWTWEPSAAADNPLAALDAGARLFGTREAKGHATVSTEK
ncbi:FAD-dependent oxidoreductase [Paenibacillus sp. IB182496]|uniref:FAD-dependent oxidoreductase n=1 Tax=Paenibacillus sabuli TaxID=2772509 RepID=A0A927GUL0_9BACL|nr:FAD-dependent oxidoreductase [Paenibacillus sabuli]MBD2847817.1 FAD-dependent oxidoreductase [Paenibacillus sabuli]